jgi:RNA polymerase sigma-70 factor (family 1)
MKVLAFRGSEHSRPYAACGDDVLVRALQAEDERAFAEIYARYWPPLYTLACRKLHSGPDAEEVVQDLFVALWRKRATAQIQQLEAYLFSAAKYRIIDCLRARLTHQGYVRYAAPRLRLADSGTEETLGAAELAAALAASVGSLPEHARQIYQLSREQYRSVPEIAVQLNLAPKTVEYHLTRSLRFLRARLKDFLLLLLSMAVFGA